MTPDDDRPGGYQGDQAAGSQPPAWDAPSGPSRYPYPPPPPPGTYPAAGPSEGNPGRPWSIAGLVCGILAIILVPIVLGPLGAIFGFIGNSKGDRMGLWVGIGSIAATVVGILLGIALLNAANDDAMVWFG